MVEDTEDTEECDEIMTQRIIHRESDAMRELRERLKEPAQVPVAAAAVVDASEEERFQRLMNDPSAWEGLNRDGESILPREN